MGRLLAAIATLAALALVAAVAVPPFIDWKANRAELDGFLSGITGWSVRTEGDIEVALLPEPHARFESLSIRDGSNANSAPVLTAASTDISISLQALLAGRLEADRIRIVRPSYVAARHAGPSPVPVPDGVSVFGIGTAIHEVEIVDGIADIGAAKGENGLQIVLDTVSGTLSRTDAPNDFRFAGSLKRNGRLLSLRVDASAAAGGPPRISATVTDSASKISLQTDGVVRQALSLYEGKFTASVPRTIYEPAAAKAVLALIRGKVSANLENANVSDLDIAIDPDNRPQALTGSAGLSFRDRTSQVTLQSTSFDLDAVSGWITLPPDGTPSSSMTAESLARTLLDSSTETVTHVSLTLGKLQTGGETIRDVIVSGHRSGARLIVEKLSAALPGETRLQALGAVTLANGLPQFKGTASLSGSGLSRFSRWITPAAASVPLSLAAFTIEGAVTVTPESTRLESVTGSLNGTAFGGNLRFDRAPSRKLDLTVSGDMFDLSGVDIGEGGADGETAAILTNARTLDFAEIAAPFRGYAGDLDSADIDVTVKAIKTRAFEARNLTARVKLRSDSVTVSKFNVETSDGLVVRGEGAVPLGTGGRGTFGGRLEARTPDALRRFASLAGFQPLTEPNLDQSVPAALDVTYEADTEGSSTLTVGGTAGRASVSGKAKIAGPFTNWRSGLSSANITVSAPDGDALLSQVLLRKIEPSGIAPGPGTGSLSLTGPLANAAISVSFMTPLLQSAWDGTLNLAQGPVAVSVKGFIATPHPEMFLAAEKLAIWGNGGPGTLRAEGAILWNDQGASVDGLRLQTQGNVVTGRAAIETSKQTPNVDLDLKALSFDVESAARYVLTGDVDVPDSTPNGWVSRPFSLSAIQGLAGRLKLDAGTFKLSRDLRLADGHLSARIEKGGVEVQTLQGALAGGTMSGTASIAAKGNRTDASAKIVLTDIDLAALAPAGKTSMLTGRASMVLSASGEALSPQALLSTARGHGSVTISDGQLNRLAPSALPKAGDDVLALATPPTDADLSKRLQEASQSGDFKFRHLKIPITIRDGLLQIPRASFRGRDGTVRLEATLDLVALKADTAWQLGVAADRKRRWPPVKLVAGGAIQDFGDWPRSIIADEFLRTLQVRKMEKDLTRLESLNKTSMSLSQWTATQEGIPQPGPRKSREKRAAPFKPKAPAGPGGPEFDKSPASPTSSRVLAKPPFETRIRGILDGTEPRTAPPR